METLCSSGYIISLADKKALDHYLNVTPKGWATSALKGMINKSIKIIMRDYFNLYKSQQTGNISTDMSVIIPALINMVEFKPYNIKTPEMVIVERIGLRDQEIWSGGFDVESFEKQALQAYYDDPEGMLEWFMENKIYQRKKALVKVAESAMFQDPEITEIPTKQDDMINLYTSLPNYKTRLQLEAEAV